jgi:hypothetical protein
MQYSHPDKEKESRVMFVSMQFCGRKKKRVMFVKVWFCGKKKQCDVCECVVLLKKRTE